MGTYLNNATVKRLRICMVTVKGPGNKAPVKILTHNQRQLSYGTSNWANNATFSSYCIAISAKSMYSYLKNATVKISENVLGDSQVHLE